MDDPSPYAVPLADLAATKVPVEEQTTSEDAGADQTHLTSGVPVPYWTPGWRAGDPRG